MFLALQFHKGVSVGLGIAESLLSALCLTGLGDAVWIYLPAAWASRLVCTVMNGYGGDGITTVPAGGSNAGRLGSGVWICTAVTVAGCILYVVWGCFWDGTKGSRQD